MSKTQYQNLKGELRQHEPMARHVSWRAGGNAQYFYRPLDIEDLAAYFKQLDPSLPVYWVGLGSNLLIRDGGINGVVICTSGVLNTLRFLDKYKVYVEAGVASPKLARQCARHALQGAEFLCGIPGTIGGALAMNAGAMGDEIWSLVESVKTIDRDGHVHVRAVNEYKIAYRSVSGPEHEWFVAATLKLQQGEQSDIENRIKNHLARRAATQPVQLPNAGSVFRNPQGDYAARLIEECGLKGTCKGGACVSEKHANFIINTGTATAKDIETLIEHVQEVVEREQGVLLQREVKIMGDNDD